MVAALTLDEGRQRTLLVIRLLLLVVGFCLCLLPDHPPAGLQDFLTRHLEFYAVDFAQDSRCRELAVVQEDTDKAACHEVKDLALSIAQVLGDDTRGDDGMVVGDLRRVEDALRLLQRFATDGLDERCVGCHAGELGLVETVHGLRTLGVDVIREVLGVHTRIRRVFLLIQCLDEVQCHLGRKAEFAVAVHLQTRQVVELRRLLLAFFLLHLGDGEGLALDGLEGLFPFLLAGELSFSGGKCRIAVDRGQHPVGFGLEVVYLLLAVDDEC